MQALNRFLIEYTGRPITTGTTGRLMEFVVRVCVIAFPHLLDPDRKETIVRKPYDRAELRVKKAIERVLKDHLSNEQSEKIRDWQHLVLDWKPATHLVLEAKGVHIYFCKDDHHTEWRVKSTEALNLICPVVPYVSDEIAVQQLKMKPPERAG
jgi:hypothetical protein